MEVYEISTCIFKRDTTGNIRVWWFETGTDGTKWGWRTNSGIQNGKMVTSGWTIVEQKNVGKVNETSLQDQAFLEGNAERQKKLERGYFENLKEVDTFDKFKPMLAHKFEDHVLNFDKNVYYSQPKLDGIRCIARANGLWTREGKEIVAVPHIREYLKVFFQNNPGAILDGELYNHELKDDFNKITSMVRKTKPTDEDFVESARLVQYHVYDCFIPSAKLQARNQFVCDMGFGLPVCLVQTKLVHDKEHLDELYGEYLENGYEGQMVRIDAPYENKRSKTLLKRKEFLTDEFKVVAIEEGKGNWSGYVKRFILELPNGTQFGAGVRGSQGTLKALFESNETPNWATLRYFTPTPDGIPRFPVVIDWGLGKRED